MSGTQQALGFARPVAASRSSRPPWRFRFQGSDTTWAIAFLVPYLAVFAAFVVYPIAFGLWMGSDPALYDRLFSDPLYLDDGGQHAAVRRHRRERADVPGIPAVWLLHAAELVDQDAAGDLSGAVGACRR